MRYEMICTYEQQSNKHCALMRRLLFVEKVGNFGLLLHGR